MPKLIKACVSEDGMFFDLVGASPPARVELRGTVCDMYIGFSPVPYRHRNTVQLLTLCEASCRPTYPAN